MCWARPENSTLHKISFPVLKIEIRLTKFQFTGVDIWVGRATEQATEWPPIDGPDHGRG